MLVLTGISLGSRRARHETSGMGDLRERIFFEHGGKIRTVTHLRIVLAEERRRRNVRFVAANKNLI